MLANDHRILQVLGSVLLLFMLTFVDVTAQTTQSATAVTDTFVTIVQSRTQDEIKAHLAYVASVRTAAQARKERLKEEMHVLDGRIKSLEKDIESLEGRLDTLDSDKDSAAYATGKERKALLEKLKDLLETRTDARKAETEAAQAALGYVEAREAMCSQESALLAKKAERDAAAKKSGAAAALPALEQAIKSMETGVHDRWEKALSAHDDWVSADKDLLKALRKLAEAQDEFHAP
jgi:chromosome segregation ATPase